MTVGDVDVAAVFPFVDVLPDAVIPTGVGLAVYLFWRLLTRGDRLTRDSFHEVKEQRDEWRARAEAAETEAFECSAELARYRLRYGNLPKER